MLALEALAAKHGDCLLLHYGALDKPKLIVIDGGPAGVWNKQLKCRLDELHKERGGEQLEIELLLVSHIDDDHINGILGLTDHLIQLQQTKQPRPYRIRRLWHNAFDDILGNHSTELATAAAAAAAAGIPLRTTALPLSKPTQAVATSVPQGRRLRENRRPLELPDNDPFPGLVSATTTRTIIPIDSLHVTIVGPLQAQVDALQVEWDRKLKQLDLARPADQAEAAEFLDKGAYNLSSIVLLIEAKEHNKPVRILLTGDARGDHILQGLETAGLLKPGKTLPLDVLKVPHHGSHHNVNAEFFHRLPAKHLLISGDGGHGNPEPETFEYISEGRGNDTFTIHLTYPLEELRDKKRASRIRRFLAADKKVGKRYEVVSRKSSGTSCCIQLQ